MCNNCITIYADRARVLSLTPNIVDNTATPTYYKESNVTLQLIRDHSDKVKKQRWLYLDLLVDILVQNSVKRKMVTNYLRLSGTSIFICGTFISHSALVSTQYTALQTKESIISSPIPFFQVITENNRNFNHQTVHPNYLLMKCASKVTI